MIVPILEQLVGRSEIYPLIAPVQKYSLRYFFYEGVIYGYIGISLLLVVRVANYNFHTSSWTELSGIFFSMVIVNALGQVFGHELIHRRGVERWIGKIMSIVYSFGSYYYVGHVTSHHNPLITCTEQDAFADKDVSYIDFIKISRPDYGGFISNFLKTLFFILVISFYFSWLASFILFTAGICGAFYSGIYSYMQHYGLKREKFEKYSFRNNWDCDFIVSNFLFLNLPKHSHHHDEQYLPYWKLKTYKNSRRLPYGYVTMLYLFLFRKKFFSVMNELILAYNDKYLRHQHSKISSETLLGSIEKEVTNEPQTVDRIS